MAVNEFLARIPGGPHIDRANLLPFVVAIINDLIDNANSNFVAVSADVDTLDGAVDGVTTKTDLLTVTSATDLDALRNKLALITVTGSVDLDTLFSTVDAYTTSNVVTDRTLDANAGAGAISSTPTQAEVEGIRDALLGLADVVGTLVEDLQAKGVVG